MIYHFRIHQIFQEIRACVTRGTYQIRLTKAVHTLSTLQIFKNDIQKRKKKRMKQIVGKWYISFLVVMPQFYIQLVRRVALPSTLI